MERKFYFRIHANIQKNQLLKCFTHNYLLHHYKNTNNIIEI